ncbi:TrkH family potassium uptake protein [Facklamia miroungae]|uniref:Trk system potassium uptake protein TrkH n=1 Tax=Facklamia miroungae TaxID=120956 RepID=A0A1G7PEU7_9LACT|nr:TrkH family potassium uptake protein [Facklamia miroungae]NKZ28663.1 Trk family potassium uptake protein [Facklamia miroungae]SDF83990.1 trk system potassium uptake protein TrkH [Facklamia miroungae]
MLVYMKSKKDLVSINPAKLFFYSYLALILIGSICLKMPFATKDGVETSLIDSIFTASSAVCVTGLATLTTASHWSPFGKIVILTLIQIGGIGVMTGVGTIGMLMGRRLSFSNRKFLAEEKNTNTFSEVSDLVRYVAYSTLIIEAFGAILLSFQFIPEYGLIHGIINSVFHSISAFCNAGFDILGDKSLMGYVDNNWVNLVIMVLIILGGLGFSVSRDLLHHQLGHPFRLHTKLVLVTTGIFIVVPALFFLAIEWQNPSTLGHLDIIDKVSAAFFQSVTTRTAGFMTIDQGGLETPSYIVTTFLMFIGGAPGGTAGGLKVTTFACLILYTLSYLRESRDTVVFKRRLPRRSIQKALSIFFISLSWIGVALILLTIFEPNKSLINLYYEIVSAYGTVGLSQGITATLSVMSKLVIVFTMIFGKIGPMAMFYVFFTGKASNNYREAEESILVG